MHKGRHVSWMPSYGPEMRGGAANCSVIISDKEIGSPIISQPDILVALSLPSFSKFEPAVSEGGLLFANSSLIPEKSKRGDIKAHYIRHRPGCKKWPPAAPCHNARIFALCHAALDYDN